MASEDEPRSSPSEDFCCGKLDEGKFRVLLAMAIGDKNLVHEVDWILATGNERTQKPTKTELLEEALRRYELQGLKQAGSFVCKPSSTWTKNSMVDWLKNHPIQDEPSRAFVRRELQNLLGLKPAVQLPNASAPSNPKPFNHQDATDPNGCCQPGNFGSNPSQYTERLGGSLNLGTTRPKICLSGEGLDEQECKVLMAQALGLPLCDFQEAPFREQTPQNRLTPTDEMLLAECQRRAGTTWRQVMIQWLMTHPVKEAQEIELLMHKVKILVGYLIAEQQAEAVHKSGHPQSHANLSQSCGQNTISPQNHVITTNHGDGDGALVENTDARLNSSSPHVMATIMSPANSESRKLQMDYESMSMTLISTESTAESSSTGIERNSGASQAIVMPVDIGYGYQTEYENAIQDESNGEYAGHGLSKSENLGSNSSSNNNWASSLTWPQAPADEAQQNTFTPIEGTSAIHSPPSLIEYQCNDSRASLPLQFSPGSTEVGGDEVKSSSTNMTGSAIPSSVGATVMTEVYGNDQSHVGPTSRNDTESMEETLSNSLRTFSVSSSNNSSELGSGGSTLTSSNDGSGLTAHSNSQSRIRGAGPLQTLSENQVVSLGAIGGLGFDVEIPESADDDTMSEIGASVVDDVSPTGKSKGAKKLVKDKKMKDKEGRVGTYTGECLRSRRLTLMPHGEGKMEYADGEVFEGHWFKGVWEGHGRLECAAHGRYAGYYAGRFEKGLFSGPGLRRWPDGSEYDGEWRDGKRSGKGTLHHEGGGRSEGNWVDDQLHGYGRRTFVDTSQYEGAFLGGVQQGDCKYRDRWGVDYEGEWVPNHVFSDGSRYDGLWKDNKANGYGKQRYPSGDIYEGGFVNGKRQGFGKIVSSDKVEYEGEWRHDMYHGKGKWLHPSGDSYEGCFINNQKEGLGKYVGSQGLEYDGEWKNDKYHGRGHWKNPNGDSYIGCFVEHKRDGLGTYTFADGSVYDGPSKNGSRHGKGSLKEPNGDLYEVEYVNGVRRTKRAL